MPHLACLGLGYSALALSRRILPQGFTVSGTCRTPEKAAALAALGIKARVADRDQPPIDADAELATVTHVLSSVPPDDAGDPALDLWGPAIARHGRLSWVGYLSTTGVYGDRQGGWVDEGAALEPTGERGRRRVAAERGWLELHARHGVPVHLFRLAAIYGPGKSALDAVRAGRAQRVIKAGQVFSRIHVDDLVAVLGASIGRPNPGAVYNVCDDDPAPPDEVIAYACALLGVPAPPAVPFEEAALSPMARSFYADNKRVSSRRIKEELGVELAFPDYRTGLNALLLTG